MQNENSLTIWTRMVDFTSYDDNHHAKSASEVLQHLDSVIKNYELVSVHPIYIYTYIYSECCKMYIYIYIYIYIYEQLLFLVMAALQFYFSLKSFNGVEFGYK